MLNNFEIKQILYILYNKNTLFERNNQRLSTFVACVRKTAKTLPVFVQQKYIFHLNKNKYFK